MENIENVKKLVSALKSINQDIEREPKCFMTPLQVKATEETLYKISGIKVNINSIRDFKELEEYYQKKYLSNNNDGNYLEEEWIKAEKEIDEYPNGTKYKAIGGGYWIKLGVGRYKWCTGAVFPRVGGDWSGYIMLPKEIISNKKIEYGHWYPVKDNQMPENLLPVKEVVGKYEMTETVLIPHSWGNGEGSGEYFPAFRMRKKGTDKWEWYPCKSAKPLFWMPIPKIPMKATVAVYKSQNKE